MDFIHDLINGGKKKLKHFSEKLLCYLYCKTVGNDYHTIIVVERYERIIFNLYGKIPCFELGKQPQLLMRNTNFSEMLVEWLTSVCIFVTFCESQPSIPLIYS